MKWIIGILVVVAVLLLLGLIWTSIKRKRDQVGRERAQELRSEAAGTVLDQHEQEARARQVQAEAQRAKAEADQLEVQAAKEQTAYDQTRAQREHAVREADRLDPDVDHRSDDYAPDLDGGTPTQRVNPDVDHAHHHDHDPELGGGTPTQRVAPQQTPPPEPPA
jgi:FtsZ-interacting cell division protein ZipA